MADFTDQEYENFRMYHQLQYDRMDKLENRRETFSNIVLSVSLAVVALRFSNETDMNKWFGGIILLILAYINYIAILFAKRSYEFFKMHQKRAKMAREKYAPQFNEINETVGKRDSSKDPYSRPKLYIRLHWIVILLLLVSSLVSFVVQEKKVESNCCCEAKKSNLKQEAPPARESVPDSLVK